MQACRERGDETGVFVLPAEEDDASLQETEEIASVVLGGPVERIPPPRPSATEGPGQRQMRHAYRVYAFLGARAPDLLLATQALGAPYFAMCAREAGTGFLPTRFAIVLAPFELQRRLNERLITTDPFALLRFQLERDVAAGADLAVAPSRRFVENAVQTGAAAETSRFVVLPQLETVTGAPDAPPGRPAGFVIPDTAPLARNIAFFATVARRHPDALRDAGGQIRLLVDAPDPTGELATLCRERFAGTDVAWTVGGPDRDPDSAAGAPVLFVPYCEDFHALGGALQPALSGAPVLIGAGAAPGEPFEAAGVAVPPFPDAVATAMAEAATGRRPLRIAPRPGDLIARWTRCLDALPPQTPVSAPAPVADAPRVTVCVLHFNRPALVAQAVASALAQTYAPLDVLIRDDGSNAPGVVEALEALAAGHAGRVRLLREDNRYTGAAHNAAARAAAGEYVYFLDDDNVLKPEAVATLLRAAETTGADFAGTFSDIFTGERPPEPGRVAEQRILQAGGDGGFSLFRNAILDGNFLCRRDAFLALGGHTEDYGIGKEDQEFFARALQAGRRVAIVPEALFWVRHGKGGVKSLHFDWTAGHFRVLEAYWPAAAPHQRGLLLLLQGLYIERNERDERHVARSGGRDAARSDHLLALARSGPWVGLDRLEACVRLAPEWLDRARQRGDAEPAVELRRNGRVLARTVAGNLGGETLRIPVGRRAHWFREALYSLHDAATGDALAALVATPFGRAGRVDGAVESRPGAEVRGWLLDPDHPERRRRVAILLNDRLHAVVVAEDARDDIARWKGTDGRHGFRWRLPEAGATTEDGSRIDVFDADTGRPLRGSPVRIAEGRAVASGADTR